MEHPNDQSQRSEQIRKLNDEFRHGIPHSGTFLVTDGVQSFCNDLLGDFGPLVLSSLFQAIDDFSDFTPDNDPYREHDFGAVEVQSNAFWWKIDYYDPDMLHGSSDPADESKTKRVMTIMLPSEY